jgi:hypothetical protein
MANPSAIPADALHAVNPWLTHSEDLYRP